MEHSKHEKALQEAADIIKQASYIVGFTGAGISVESGIPPFRGRGGLWEKYDPTIIDLDYFYNNPLDSWKMIKKLFYDSMGKARPNPGHKGFYDLESRYRLKSIITQNIDGLHQEAGNSSVIEYHGTITMLSCTECGNEIPAEKKLFETLPVLCPKCRGLVKPDFVFFGEAIPSQAARDALDQVRRCDLLIVVGTTGEVMPACQLPYEARRTGAKIIEINPDTSAYTATLTHTYIPLEAGDAFTRLSKFLK